MVFLLPETEGAYGAAAAAGNVLAAAGMPCYSAALSGNE